MKQKKIVLIRADASTRIGTGHVMRCLALAQAWQDNGGAVCFACAELPSSLGPRLHTEGIPHRRLDTLSGTEADALQTAMLAHELGADWVVLDGYQFDGKYQQIIKDSDLQLLAIDDFGHAGRYYADIVLNQNSYATSEYYKDRTSNTRLLLGTTYTMLRREFWTWRGWKRVIAEHGKRLLVTMGGSDPDNVTLKILQAIEQVCVSRLEVNVIVGPSNPHHAVLGQAAEQSSHIITLHRHVRNMPELMAWADIAIAAGGSTCWEIAFMGLPAILLVLAENQVAVTATQSSTGCAIDLGYHTLLAEGAIAEQLGILSRDADRRRAMAARGQQLVDGNGTLRVVRQMLMGAVTLRAVSPDDSMVIWEWANDTSVRAQSFSSRVIPWEEHQSWFNARLVDPATCYYIAEDAHSTMIGQVRFQLMGGTAVISVSLAPSQRGKGYGAEIIRCGTRRLFDTTNVNCVNAYIKPENVASIHAFANAGFSNIGVVDVDGHRAHKYVLTRS